MSRRVAGRVDRRVHTRGIGWSGPRHDRNRPRKSRLCEITKRAEIFHGFGPFLFVKWLALAQSDGHETTFGHTLGHTDHARSGLYQTASEVVREALRLLKERDHAREQFRGDVQVGFDALARGEGRICDKASGRARALQAGARTDLS